MWKESSFDKSKNNEIDSSKKKALTEEGKLLRLADEILAKKEDVSLGEKTEIIRNYLKKDFIQEKDTGVLLASHYISIEDKKMARDYFLRMTPTKLESTFGKEELNLIFRVISEYSALLKKTEEFIYNNLSEENIKEFKEQNEHEILPYRFHYTLDELKTALNQLRNLFLCRWGLISQGQYEKSKKKFAQMLKKLFFNLNKKNKEWQECSKSETEAAETPIEIRGFEEFDFPEIKGKEIIAKALEILPKEFSAIIESIEFKKKILSRPKTYDFDLSTTIAKIYFQEIKHKIRFFPFFPIVPLDKLDDRKRINYLKKIPFVLGCKLGHILNPRLVDQKDLTLQEQLKMIMDWEKIRAEEEEWSRYTEIINDPDLKEKILLEDEDSFAESIGFFFVNSYKFQKLYPKRAEFITNLFKKRFPEFNLEKSFSAKEEYDALINTLEQKVKK